MIRILLLCLTMSLSIAMNAQDDVYYDDVYYDDVYYIPSKDTRQVTDKKGLVVAPAKTTTNETTNYSDTRDVDEYNRRGSTIGDTAVYYEEDTTRLFESSFDDANSDVAFPYTKRVMRFHAPHVGFIVSSPYYWDVCYADIWDVYYDGWAAYTPSYVYWSYTYDPWYYNRWHFRTCWDFTWGWYDPWYFRAYWGWGRPIYWGWSRPIFHPRHIGRPMWAHRGFSRGYAPGFGHNGGRGVFSGRGFDAPRAGAIAGREGGARISNRPLSGLFRSNRNPAPANGGSHVGRGARQGGSSTAMRPNTGINRNINDGVRRQSQQRNGSVSPNRNQPTQTQSQRTQTRERNLSQGTVIRTETPRSTPSYGGGGVGRSTSIPSSVGNSSGGSRGGGMSGGGGASRGGRR